MSEPELPDFLQPAADEDAGFEDLLARADAVEEMAAGAAFDFFRDYLLMRARNEEAMVIGGKLTHEEYLRRTGIIAGLLLAAKAPTLMREMVETRRPSPPATKE